MTKATQSELAENYLAALRSFLANNEGEAGLHRAHELGRRALRQGLGLLDLATIHQESRERLWLGATELSGRDEMLAQTLEFFTNVLTPYEMAYRGFEEANATLRRLSQNLERQVAQRTRALAESEARYRRLLEMLPAAAYTCDVEGLITYFNERAVELWGREPKLNDAADRFCGSFRLFSPDGSPIPHEQCWMALALREDKEYEGQEIVVERLDGIRRTVLAHANPIHDRSGQVIGAVNVLVDITDRERTERALRESEQRFARFMEHLPGLAWIKDREGRYVFANDAAEKAFRTPRADLYGKTDIEVFPAEMAAQFQENDRRALASEAGILTVETFEHEDGILHYSLVSKFPIPGPNGQPVMVGGMAIDITERKQAEEALRESEARKTAMFQAALDCIISIDHDGKIIDFNPAAERTFGYRREEVLGREMAELVIPPSLRERHRRGMAHYLATGEGPVLNRRLEMAGMRADGTEFSAELAVTRIPTDGPPQFTAYLRDITKRKRAEDRLRELTENLERRVEQRTLHVKLLQDVAVIANEAESFEQALEASLRCICQSLQWPIGHVFVPAHQGAVELVSSGIWFLSQPERFASFRKVTESMRFTPGRSVPGQVLATGRPSWFLDVSNEPNFILAGAARDVGLRGGLAFPVLVQKEVAAVLEFFAFEPGKPDNDLLKVVTHVGTQLGRVVERTRAATTLRRSEQYFRSLIENALDIITVLDREGTVLYESTAAERVLGYKLKELVGTSVFGLVHPADLAQVRKTFQDGIQNPGAPRWTTFRCRHKNGSWRVLESIGQSFLDDPEVGVVIVNSRDVTERTEAEETIRSLLRISKKLNSTLDIDTLLDDLVREALGLVNAEAGLSGLRTPEGLVGHRYVRRSEVLPLVERWLSGEGLPGWLIEHKAPYVTNDAPHDKRIILERCVRFGIRSAIGIPILNAEGDVIGFFEIHNKQTRGGFTQEDVAVLTAVADLASLAIQNALAYRDLQETYADLAEHQRLLAEAQAIAHIGSWEWDVLANRLNWSDELYRIYGLDTQQSAMDFEAFLDRVHPDDRVRVKLAVEEAYRTTQPFSFDERIVRPDGTIRVLRSHGDVITDETGSVVRMFGTCQDVTESQRQAEALRLANQKLQALIAASPLAIFVLDREGNVQAPWNPAAERIFGWTQEEVLGRPLPIVPPEKQPEFRAMLQRVLDGEWVVGFEARRQRKDGPLIDVSISAAPLVEGDGRIVGLMEVVADISERKRVEQAMRDSELRFRSIWESSIDGMRLTNGTGTVVAVNQSYCHLMDMKPGELIGQPFTVVYSDQEEDRAAMLRRYQQDFRERSIEKFRERALTLRSGQRRHLLITNSFIASDPQSPLLLSIFRDITELKHAQERALQKERLAAIGEMTTGLAHESRNALQRGQACLERLALKLEDRPEALDMIRRAQAAQDDLHQIYEEVRAYASPLRFRYELSDLGEIFRQTWEGLDPLRGGREVRIREIGGIIDRRCRVDRFAMGQVFLNILENALDACPDPVEIDLVWSEAELDGLPAVRVAIRDNGPGLTAEMRERIFEPFYTTKTRGTGLGMAIVKRLVEGHHGQIEVGSDSGRGTEICITLPRKQS